MCYVSGFIGKNNQTFNTSKLLLLSIGNRSRGDQSTGLYTPANGIVKDNVGAEKFWGKNISSIIPDTIALLHGRFPTTAYRDACDSHPFQKEYENKKIVFIHNGCVSNVKTVADKFKLENPRVDTEIIGEQILREGVETLKELSGNLNILFVDPNDPTKLNVHRRNYPLFVGEAPEGLYFSSLEDPLKNICCENIKQLDEHKIYSYVNGICVEEKEIEKPPVAVFSYNRGSSSRGSSYYDNEDYGDYYGWRGDYNRSTYNKKTEPAKLPALANEDLTRSELIQGYISKKLEKFAERLYLDPVMLFKYCNMSLKDIEEMADPKENLASSLLEYTYIQKNFGVNVELFKEFEIAIQYLDYEGLDTYLPKGIRANTLVNHFKLRNEELYAICDALPSEQDKLITKYTGATIETVEIRSNLDNLPLKLVNKETTTTVATVGDVVNTQSTVH